MAIFLLLHSSILQYFVLYKLPQSNHNMGCGIVLYTSLSCIISILNCVFDCSIIVTWINVIYYKLFKLSSLLNIYQYHIFKYTRKLGQWAELCKYIDLWHTITWHNEPITRDLFLHINTITRACAAEVQAFVNDSLSRHHFYPDHNE